MPRDLLKRPENPLDRLALEFSTLGPVGHLPWAPGTWGSAAAVLFAPWLLLQWDWPVRLGLVLAVFVLGGLAASRTEKLMARKDPGAVVVDELAGQWLVLVPFVHLEIWHLGMAFVLFRLFDILKPWPVRRSETWLPGGFGIMIDDILAGIYAAFLLGMCRSLIPLLWT